MGFSLYTLNWKSERVKYGDNELVKEANVEESRKRSTVIDKPCHSTIAKTKISVVLF